MCLIAFSFRPGSEQYLQLAANRDEFHQRPTLRMGWWAWPDGPLAGRDEAAGGTWIAVARDGRWAAVTNVRDPAASAGTRSRGELPVSYLSSGLSPEAYARSVRTAWAEYGPFNLLAGDRRSLWWASSHADPVAVPPGVHALSNGLLNAPWPKSRRVAESLEAMAHGGTIELEHLFGLMDDRKAAPDSELPETGVGTELERFLSPPFIVGDRYGTRCTTLLTLGIRHHAAERTFDPAGRVDGERQFGWTATSAP